MRPLIDSRRDNPAYLKLDLYCRGLRLDASCYVEGDGGRKILRTRAGLGSGLELILPGGLWTNVPVAESFAQSSPYTLHRSEDGYRLRWRGKDIARVRLSPRPAWYDRKTSTGKPMTRVGTLQGTYLGIYPAKVCEYWTAKPQRTNCKFCSGGLNLGADDADDKSVSEVLEVVRAARDRRRRGRRLRRERPRDDLAYHARGSEPPHVGAFGLVACVNRLRFARRVASEASQMLATSGEPRPVERARLATLPSPVRRYLEKALGSRERAVRSVRLRHGGTFRTSLDGKWLPIRGDQYFAADPPGFIWWGRISTMPGLWVEARDRSVGGTGNMLVRAESTFTLADARGPELDQGALLRLLGEMLWFPTALLDERYVTWTPLDERRTTATSASVGAK